MKQYIKIAQVTLLILFIGIFTLFIIALYKSHNIFTAILLTVLIMPLSVLTAILVDSIQNK